jgi:uncharacterized RmlC-like cupin family protein
MPTKDRQRAPYHVNEAVEGPDEVVTVRPDFEVMTRQQLPNFVGISGETAGATGLSMNVVIIPAGGAAEPHLHRGHETAIFLLKGKVETRYGPDLGKSVVSETGDFIYIPADVPHQPVNLSDEHPAYAIVARNDPNEQENVVLYRRRAATRCTCQAGADSPPAPSSE